MIYHYSICVNFRVGLFIFILKNRSCSRRTDANIMQRRVLHQTHMACISRCGASETTTHLFLHCDIFGSLWPYIWRWLQISLVIPADIRQFFIQFIHMPGLPRFTHSFLKVIWFAYVWVLWKKRNNRVFQNLVSDPSTTVEYVKLHSFLWLKSKHANFSFSYHDWWKHPLLCMGVHDLVNTFWCFTSCTPYVG